MFEPNKTVKVRLVFDKERPDKVDLVCAYFPAKGAYTYEDWGITREVAATEEEWFVINGHYEVKFINSSSLSIPERPDFIFNFDRYVEFDIDIWEGSDPFWYNWREFCEQAEKIYKKISSRRYLAYKEKFV